MNQNLKADIRNVIQKYREKVSGALGVYFLDLKTGFSVGFHEDEVFPAASVFKVFVLAEIIRLIQKGELSFEERFALAGEDKSEGSGVLQYLGNGINLSIYDYATLMMIISDNTAADFLFKKAGRENIIKNVLQPLNFRNTKCDLTCADLIRACYQIKPGESLEDVHKPGNPGYRNTKAFTGELEYNDETSPREAAEMVRMFYTGEWINKDAGNAALEIMKLCQTNARIPRYLPVGTVVAHKTGSMDRVANDVGVVYTPKGDYILSLFYNGNTASEKEYGDNAHNYFSEETLAHISWDIYREYVKG